MAKKTVIFDLDGTLLNTISDLGEACNYALRKLDKAEHPISAYNYMVGNGVRNLMTKADPEATPEEMEQLLKHFREYYNEHCHDHTVPYPGIPEVLKELHSHGIALAVATNKYQEAADKIIRYFFPDIPFVAIEGQIDGRNIKPDPSVLFSILSSHPTPKREVLMVGDSAVDIEMARRACVESLGVTWGFRPVSELRKALAGHVISSPGQILKYVFE